MLSIKNSVKIVLIIALSVTIGHAISTMPGFSAGAWMQKLAPAAFFGFILLLFEIEAIPTKRADWFSILKLPEKRDLSLNKVLVLIPLAVMSSLALVHYGFGTTITLSFLLAGAGILISGILIAKNKQAEGLSLLIITLPIVSFLEFQFRFYHRAFHGIFYTMPSIIILWVIGFEFLLIQLLKKQSFKSTPFNKVWLLIFVTMSVSAIFSDDHIVSFRHVLYFFSISIPFFLAVNTIKSTDDFKLCTISLALAGAIRLITMLYFEMGKMSARFEYGSQFHINLPSYNSLLGLGVTFCFFLSLGVVLSERYKLIKFFVIAGITGLLIVTILKLPRSIDIAIYFGILALLVLRKPRPWVIIGLIGAAIAIISNWEWIVKYTALGRFQDFASLQLIMINQRMRIDAYQTAVAIIKDFPIFGIGPGMWDEYYFMYMKDPVVWMIKGVPEIQYVRAAHNIFLQQGATCGILGLISIAMLAFLMFKQLITALLIKNPIVSKNIIVAFISTTVVCWIVYSIGGGAFEISYSPEEHYWFWYFVGIIAACTNIQKKKTYL